MEKAKIGKREGSGTSDGHATKQQSSDRELWLKMAEFQKNLTAKLNADSGTGDNDYDTLVNIEE